MEIIIVTNELEDPRKCASLNTRGMHNLAREHGCTFISALDQLADVSPEYILKMSNSKEHDVATTSDWHERNKTTNNNVVNGLLSKIEKLKLLEDKYSGKMNNIVAGSGSLVQLLPKRTHYAALTDYDKKKLYKIMSDKASILPDQRKLMARKHEISKVISRIERDIKKADKSLSKVKGNLEKIIPGVSIRFESLKSIEGRRSISGYTDLTKGKQAIFGHRAREFVLHREQLELAKSKLDKAISTQSSIELGISTAKEQLERYNNEMELVLPGSSLSTIESIKSGKLKTLKIHDVFPEFTTLPSKVQSEFLKLIRLRNTKAQDILDINDKINVYHTKILDDESNITYDFRSNAVDFANDLYMASTNEQKPHHKSLIWTAAYFLYTSSRPCICLDDFEIYPDAFHRFIESISRSLIDKTIYISSIYTPKTIPTGVSIHTVEPR